MLIHATLLDNLAVVHLAVFVAAALFVLAFGRGIARWLAARRARAELVERQLRGDGSVLLMAYGPPLGALGVFALGLAFGAGVLAFVVAFVLYFALDAWPRLLVRRRHQQFDEQLPDTLMTLGHGLKAGLSLPQAVGQIVSDAPRPTCEEFAEIQHEYEMGKPIAQAVDDARERLPSRNYELAVTAFKVGKQQGGNLATVFEKIANSIREIWRIEEHIRTVSTQGRSSARFMTYMPGVFLVLLYFMDPVSTGLLFSDPLGLTILAIVFVFNVIGHLWIQRILKVDI